MVLQAFKHVINIKLFNIMISQPLKPYVIGLDLGGTNSVFGVVDSRGDIKVTTAIKTQIYTNVDDYVNASIDALQIIIDQVGGIDKIKAMGIGAPNANYYKGTIEYAPNIVWAMSAPSRWQRCSATGLEYQLLSPTTPTLPQ